MNHSIPGLPVHHQLLEFTQTHAHRVIDAFQPSHPLSSPCPPAPNPSQHQGLFQWVNSLHQVAKVLEFQLQHQFFQWTPRTNLLYNALIGSPCSPRDSQESSPTPQFKSISFSAYIDLKRIQRSETQSYIRHFAKQLPILYTPVRKRGPNSFSVDTLSTTESQSQNRAIVITIVPDQIPLHSAEKESNFIASYKYGSFFFKTAADVFPNS